MVLPFPRFCVPAWFLDMGKRGKGEGFPRSGIARIWEKGLGEGQNWVGGAFSPYQSSPTNGEGGNWVEGAFSPYQCFLPPGVQDERKIVNNLKPHQLPSDTCIPSKKFFMFPDVEWNGKKRIKV